MQPYFVVILSAVLGFIFGIVLGPLTPFLVSFFLGPRLKIKFVEGSQTYSPDTEINWKKEGDKQLTQKARYIRRMSLE